VAGSIWAEANPTSLIGSDSTGERDQIGVGRKMEAAVVLESWTRLLRASWAGPNVERNEKAFELHSTHFTNFKIRQTRNVSN